MQTSRFGMLVAAALANVAVLPVARADAPAKAKSAPHCVHNCTGYAACKGNGNNSCKGKNDCAGQGLVPKECSSQKAEDACKKVLDAKKNTMCSWFTE